MTIWSKLVAYLSGWPESKEERIKTYGEEREEQKKEEINKERKQENRGT